MFKHYIITLIICSVLVACNNNPPPPEITPAALNDQAAAAAPLTVGKLAQVKDITVNLPSTAEANTASAQIQVKVEGEFPDACGKVGAIQQNHKGQVFTVTMNVTADPNQMCAQVITPFTASVTLENSQNLPQGEYQVSVNGVNETFSIRTPPPPVEDSMVGVPEIIPAPLETIEVVITDTVSVMARGTFPNGCIHLGEISQEATQTPMGLKVTIKANRQTGVLCTQALVPFEVAVPLEVAGWSAGTYHLQVNDLTTTFDLPANLGATDLPSFSPVTSTEILSDWRRVDLPEMGLSVTLPAAWVAINRYTWAPTLSSSQRLSLTWTRTTAGWQPNNLLPSNAQITGRMTVELGEMTGILYQTSVLSRPELHLITPLDAPVAYDFSVNDLILQSTLEQVARSAQLSAPQLAPCTPDTTTARWVNVEGQFCLLYPLEFTLESAGQTTVINHAKGINMTISYETASRRTLDDLVQAQLRGLPTSYAIKQSRFTLGNEPAIFLEGLPGRVPTRKVFVIHAGTLYTLTIAPLDNSPEFIALWQTVARSLSFEIE